jgi:hypothetical protein
MTLFIMKFSSLSCCIVSLWPKYSPQYPILKHPQPKFVSLCEQPSYTLKQNKRQNYNSVYLYIWVAGWRKNDSAQNVSKHSWLKFALNFFLNRILILYVRPQMFEIFYPFKVTTTKLYIVTWSCILISRHD